MSKPVFEHRHYKAIAATLASVGLSCGESARQWITIRDTMADAFAKDNPRFNRERFIAAANGTPSNGRDKVR